MPRILLLTAESLPHFDHETGLLAEALTDLGVESQIVPWTSPELPHLAAELAVIRSTWDYTVRLPEYLTVLDALPMPLVNDLKVVRWNSHKGYLVELLAAGVAVVPTVLYAVGGADRMGTALPDFGSSEIIVKPAVSAGAIGVGRFPSGSPAATEHLHSILRTADALIQPFQPEITSGERSLIHLGGVFSHAVRKVPAVGDFRVQEQYGGTNAPYVPSSAELELANAALAAVPGGSEDLAYSRIDVVGTAAAPLIMELELIEPELFLPSSPGSAERFAASLAALL